MSSQVKKTNEFILVDADGNQYRTYEFTSFVSIISDGKQMFIPGIRKFQLSNGDPVNFSEDSGFELASNGVQLSKVLA